MPTRRVRTTLVVALLVLAGCNGILDGVGSGESRGTFTVPERQPPGVTERGTIDTDELLSNHTDALQGQSRTVVQTRVQRYADGGLRTRSNVTGRIGTDGEFYVVQRVDGTVPVLLGSSSGRIESWSNGSVALVAVTTDGSTAYQPGTIGRVTSSMYDRLYLLFSALEPEVAGNRTLDGHEVVVVRGRSESTDVSARGLFRSVRNVSFVAWIDEDGLVRGYRLTYTGDVDGTIVRVTETLRFRDVGSTTVPRPAWVDEAVEEACRGPEGENRCRDR